ncbi:MAG: hypothetical protein WDZ40_03135 [Candidatus Spechtbacterales bacterium]
MKSRIKGIISHPVTWIVILSILATGSFWAMGMQNSRADEVRAYNNGIRFMEEGSLNEAFEEFIKVTETLPHNSQIDAMAEYQMAWMLAKFGDGEFETLQNARALWTSSLYKAHPDKDAAINIELIISMMEDILQEQNLSQSEIDDILDGEEDSRPGDGEGKGKGEGSENENNY